MRITPGQLRQHIEDMKVNQLLLKHDIESCEFELDHSSCPECRRRLSDDLKYMLDVNSKISNHWPREIEALEERLSEDEHMNGWQGEDRFIDF